MAKQNCWEVLSCGREPGGSESDKRSCCPAAVEDQADGINHGRNGGRICWAVAGTFSAGDCDASATQSLKTCIMCDFYNQVALEEKSDFQLFWVREG